LAGDYLSLSQLMHAWVTWWIGDMMGALIVVPLIAAWRITAFREMLSARLYEAVAMLLLVVMTSLIIFNQPPAEGQLVLPLVYLVFPLIILTAARFMQIGAVTTAAILTAAAVWSTTSGMGPYAQPSAPEKGLLVLHFFILVSVLTALVLSVAVYGRVESEKALARKARELERAQRQVLKNAEQRKDLQLQMKEAQDRINDILVGILDSESSSDRPRRG
jgi:integral membrane sensor domain MASE1